MSLPRIPRTIGLSVLATLVAVAVEAQPVAYRLHRETNPIPLTGKLLGLAPPDAAVLTIQSNDLINAGGGSTHGLDTFYSPFFAQAGTIAAGSTVTFRLWMRKTVNTGKLRAAGALRIRTPNELSTTVCSGQAPSAELTTTFALYTFTCASTAAVPFTTSKVMLASVNVYVVSNINKSVRAEVAIEGIPGGNYDSQVDVPVPPPPPSISGTAPTSGPVGTAVTISGSWFGATEGTSTVTFNGVPATVAAWSASSITAIVPTTAITGPVVVTVGGASSNAVTFTVPPPVLTGLSPPTGPVGAPVTINGSGFGPSASAGGVTFNGVTAPTTSWAPTQIVAIVPAGTATGAVIATINGRASNSLTFTLITTGTLTGTVTRASDGAPVSGASVQALLNGIQQGATTTNGSGGYTITNLENGLYDIRVTATGYSAELVSNLPLPAAQTTTRNITLFAPGTLSGRITQSDGTTPLVGAAVTIFDGPVQAGQSSTTSTGDYSIANLHPGPYLVQAAYVGYQTKEQSATVPNGGSTTVNLSLSAAPTGPVTYAYDELNRLVSVVDASGASASYTYDAVGNILSIQRHGSQSVSISEFTPNSGPVGQTVTIFGSGFSSTPTQNTVTFNGASAIVTSATATKLVTTVPTGATTGPIGVTAPLGSASSSPADFTVTASTGAPTITSVSPQIASAGQTVTITGTNFEALAPNNVVRVNLSAMTPGTATPTQLQLVMPAAPVTTGRVSVTTPTGSATTADYLWVPPAPLLASNVDSTGMMPLNATTSLAVSTLGKFALRAFEGTAGQSLSLDVSATSWGSTDFLVYTPYGAPLLGGGIFSNTFFGGVVLPFTGTYTFVMHPWSSLMGSASVRLNQFTDVPIAVPTDGTPATVTTSVPGQTGRLVFAAGAGDRFSALVTNVTIPGCQTWHLTLYAPDGNMVTNVVPCNQNQGFMDAVTLPAGGTYTLVFGGTNGQVGSATIRAYKFADVTAPANLSGAPTAVATSIPGQSVRLTFNGVTDQRISMMATNVAVTEPIPTSCQWTLALMAPNGSTVVGDHACLGATAMFVETVTLPADGMYTVVFGGEASGFGSATVRVYDVVHVTAALTPGDPGATYTTTAPGQDVNLTFLGVEGQMVSVLARNVAVTEPIPTSCQWTLHIKRSNGSTVVGDHACFGASALFLDTVTLPADDVYTVVFGGEASGVGNAELTVYNVVHVTGNVNPGDPAATYSTTVPGQDVRLTFSADAGQRVSLLAENVTFNSLIPTSCEWAMQIFGPAPTTYPTLVSQGACGSATRMFLDPVTLPSAGTYTFGFGGTWTATTAGRLTLYGVPPDTTATTTVNGSAVTLAMTVPGQKGLVTFPCTAQQAITVRVTNNTLNPMSLSVYDQANWLGSAGPVGATTYNMGATVSTSGTCQVVLDPTDTVTGAATVAVTNP